MHGAFTFATGLVTLINQYDYKYSNGQVMLINFPLWIITIYGAMAIFAVFPFASYHSWLLAMGRTTNEEVRGRYDRWRGNPFDRGTYIANCRDGLKFYPSLVFTEAAGNGTSKLSDENVTAQPPAVNDQEEQKKDWVSVFEGRYEVKSRDVAKEGFWGNLDVDID